MPHYEARHHHVSAEQFLPDQPIPFTGQPVVHLDGGQFFVIDKRGARVPVGYRDWVIRIPGPGFHATVLSDAEFRDRYHEVKFA